jgi:hypothetical protein
MQGPASSENCQHPEQAPSQPCGLLHEHSYDEICLRLSAECSSNHKRLGIVALYSCPDQRRFPRIRLWISHVAEICRYGRRPSCACPGLTFPTFTLAHSLSLHFSSSRSFTSIFTSTYVLVDILLHPLLPTITSLPASSHGSIQSAASGTAQLSATRTSCQYGIPE